MTKEIFRSILNEMKTSSRIRELLADHEWTKDELADLACKFGEERGHSLTADQFHAFMAELDQERRNRTERISARLSDLSDGELGEIAGGNDYTPHEECKYTFEDQENCWSHDGCDKNHIHYKEYICNHNDYGRTCNSAAAFDCDDMFILH